MAKSWIHAEVQGPAAEERPRRSVLNGEGLNPQPSGWVRHRERRRWIPGVHQDQPLDRVASSAVSRRGMLDEFSDEVWRCWWIGEDKDLGSSRAKGREMLPIDPRGPTAIPTQASDDLVGKRVCAHDQDRGATEGEIHRGVLSGRERQCQNPRKPCRRLGQLHHLNE